MEDKKIKKTIKKASITAVITAGAVAGVIYNAPGNSFTPSLSDREYNFNYVHLDGEGDALEKKDDRADNDNALLEKDKNASKEKEQGSNEAYIPDDNKPDDSINNKADDITDDSSHDNNMDNRSDDSKLINTDDKFNAVNININNNNDIAGSVENVKKDDIYNIVDPGSNPDIIIPGGNASDIITIVPGNGTNNDSSFTGPDSDNDGSGSGSNNDDSDSRNDNGNINIGDAIEDEEDMSGTAVDPEIDKTRPGISSSFDSKPYDEDNITESPDKILRVVIQPAMSYDSQSLYKGQSVDAYTIFCVLDTYVVKMENDNPVLYLWGKESYDKYVQITGVSFDAGNSWNEDFPVTIPSDMDNNSILINARYRLSQDSEWIEDSLSYTPKDNRLFVLSDRIKNDNEMISDDKVLNYDQYPELESTVNLYKYQNDFLKDGQLEYLFPGWDENKKLVSWMYKTGIGRHILQPSAMVPLDKKYTVYKKYKWMTNDGQVDDDGTEYCSLQTLVKADINKSDDLTAVSYKKEKESGTKRLDVPVYIQSVELEEAIDVDYMSIPESVIYIDNDGVNLNVRKAYEVADDNAHYSSQDGVLMSKDKSQILAIPYSRDSIVINNGINKVVVNANNNLSDIVIKADTIETLPQLDYAGINNCRITVDDSILDEFLNLNYDKLSGTDNIVASAENPDVTHKVCKGFIVEGDGSLYSVSAAAGAGSGIRLTDDVKSISKGVFDNNDNVKRLILTGADNIVLNKDCFLYSSIEDILCNNEVQKEDIMRQLSYAGKEDINVYVASESTDGYIYCSILRDGDIVNVLIKAPQDITEFDGTIENHTININQIDDNCFDESTRLEWAILPEYVTHIGSEAFMNCTELQGVFIKNKEEISIGNNAFTGCTSLRFVASNAMNAVMEDGYDPVITDNYGYGIEENRYFFVLKDALGYGSDVNSVNSIDGIEEFRLEDIGGSYLLYGVDYYGEEFVLLRSGKDISGDIKLSKSTTYIYNYAFADAGLKEGFTIGWSDMEWLSCIHRGAFYGSGLSGNINITAEQGIFIYDSAFGQCKNITGMSIEGCIYYMGNMVFNDCESLQTVKLGYIDDVAGCMYAGLFTGCDKLESIELSNDNPPQLVIYEGNGFQFNNTWSRQEEADKLKLIVPEGTQEKYMLAWRYCVSGFTGIYSGSSYIDMWNSIQSELIDWDNFVLPKDSQVDDELKKRLLVSENYLRNILGMKKADYPTGLYTFRLSEGNLTLAGVPSDITQLDFTTDDCGLPSGWFMDYIGKDAFSGADRLEKVVIADNLAGIYSGAFNKASEDVDKLTIEFKSEKPLQLICDNSSTAFDFGIDSAKLVIIVPEGTKDTYVNEWSAYVDKEKLAGMITEKERQSE